MAEEKNEKKKAGIVKRILKWFGLVVLSILIILGLIFQAPWKVITLLLIVLAACRILPKPAIKYFWLSAGVVVIALIIWVLLPEADGDWRPYTFDEELAALEAKRAIPDSENAAVIYNKLLDNFNEEAFEPNFLDDKTYYLIRTEPWSSKDYPEIAQWLKSHQNTITKLLEASKIEKCRFPISDPTNIEQQIDYGALRHWARLLVRVANNDLGDGRVEQALEKQIALLQMGKHLCQQPATNDTLFGIAVEALTISQFNRFAVTGDATDQCLSTIESALAEIKHDWSSDLTKILKHEKLCSKNTLGSFYEVNPKGKVRLSRDPWAQLRVEWKKQLEETQIEDEQIRKRWEAQVYLTYWRKKLIKAQTILSWFFLPSTPQKAAEIIDESFEKYYAMADPDFDWQREPSEFPIGSPLFITVRLNHRCLSEWMADNLEKHLYRDHDIYLRVLSEQRGSQLLIGLRHYKNKNGYWPESLDDIKSLAPAEIFVDPVNDDSFVYKLTEENFTLYSKGKNNIDDNGEYNSTWDPNSFEGKVEEDDRLIWPTRSRKTKEGNGDAEQQ